MDGENSSSEVNGQGRKRWKAREAVDGSNEGRDSERERNVQGLDGYSEFSSQVKKFRED